MDKRYQVFVSSTFADLKDERHKVIQALMEMDCIPAGMELFPAADDEQWEFIKRIIDDCDYYVLIIGGRYGSLSDTGISYTEMEFNYAIERGLNVLAFIHEAPGTIASDRTEIDPVLRDKLDQFRDRVKTNRLVKFWKTADQLPGLVALSLVKTIKVHPAVGWVRGDTASNPELLNDLNELRKENEELRLAISTLKKQMPSESLDLASLDEVFQFKLTYQNHSQYSGRSSLESIDVSFTWLDILAAIGPSLAEHPNDVKAKKILAKALYRRHRQSLAPPFSISIADDDFETIRIQLESQGLISLRYAKTTAGNMALFWYATDRGKREIAKLRTVPPTAK